MQNEISDLRANCRASPHLQASAYTYKRYKLSARAGNHVDNSTYFEEQNKTGDYYKRRFSSYLDEHLATIIDKCHRSQDLTPHKDFLIRFSQDERMREVYGWLATEYDDDESWHNLVWAATIALADFRVYRAQLRNVSGCVAKLRLRPTMYCGSWSNSKTLK